MKNKFNRLTSKEWLPFQKSWFKFSDDNNLYRENLRFFCKSEKTNLHALYFGENYDLFSQLAKDNSIECAHAENFEGESQFILFDLRTYFNDNLTLDTFNKLKTKVIDIIAKQKINLEERRFISVLIPNQQTKQKYFPYAWDLAKEIGKHLSLKDEKIACFTEERNTKNLSYFQPSTDYFYCLYFRKDELSGTLISDENFDFYSRNTQLSTKEKFTKNIPGWFVLKPQPRKKDEILHPAKYPEDLVEMFISIFTNENDNVFDPMSGTGSSQLGALKLKRNGYGTELSVFFANIANGRCKEYIDPSQQLLFHEEKLQKFKILNKDARLITLDDFPTLDYMITSPPYWDMLNMKGAENQAKRVQKGLKTNYSDDADDMGNIANYNDFLNSLKVVYFNIASLMKPGSYMTIVVKNIKKKGTNYPFAWDLALLLQEKLILLPEVFWCQDDISIAPYGYGNTWVSNTFHQYCLNFQIPKDFKV